MEPVPAASPGDLTVEAVEWLPSGAGSGLVRVRGRWGQGQRVLPLLVATPDGEPVRHESLPDPRAEREPEVWRGAYIVRSELIEREEPLWLESGGERIDLPPPASGVATAAGAPVPPAPDRESSEMGGEVIDRAVLAERRARRAEAAEQAQARIAGEALKAVEVLELRGAELERRIGELLSERGELSGEDPVDVLHERLAAAETRALELRHEASAARADVERVRERGQALAAALRAEAEMEIAQLLEASVGEIGAVVAAAEAGAAALREELEVARTAAEAAQEADRAYVEQVSQAAAHQARALPAALAVASDLRQLVRLWTVRMRSAEVARTSDAVRLAVLESGRAARQGGATAAELAAAREEATRTREALEATQARLAELDRVGEELAQGREQRAAQAAELDAERAILAATLVELDEYRQAAEAEAGARAVLVDQLEQERAATSAFAAQLEAERAALTERFDVDRAALTEGFDAERTALTAEFEAARAALIAELDAERTALAAEQQARRQVQGELEAARVREQAAEAALADALAGRADGEDARVAAEAGLAALHAELGTAEEARQELERARAAVEAAAGERTRSLEDRVEAVEADRDAARLDVEALRTLAHAAEETRSAHESELAQLKASGSLGDRVAGIERTPAPDLDELARRAAALATPAPSSTKASPLASKLDAAAAALRARPAEHAEAAPVTDREPPRLRDALVALARVDAPSAGRLLGGLLPAQVGSVEGPRDYDVTIAGLGTFAVQLGGAGQPAFVRSLDWPRPRSSVEFRLTGSALAFAELLAGRGPRPRRFRSPVRLSGRRPRRARALDQMLATPPALVPAVRAGARLEPADVFAALPHVIPPEWTRGHTFTIAQEVLAHGFWVITVADGAPLRVERGPAPDAPEPDATVTYTRAAFDAVLRAEAPPADEKPRIRGDRSAVEVLTSWTDRLLRP